MNEEANAFLEVLRDYRDTFIAALALGLTIYHGYLARKHERASVRPFLTFERVLKLDEDFVQIVLNNHGPGTAYIKTFELEFDGKPVDTRVTVWNDLMKQIQIKFVRGGGQTFNGRDALPPQCSKELAKFISEPRAMVSLKDKVMTEICRFRVKIDYESAYGEKFSMDSADFT